MSLECLNCNEPMDILEEEQGDFTLEYSQCPKCKCKVAIAEKQIKKVDSVVERFNERERMLGRAGIQL